MKPMYLLDTNIISEPAHEKPNKKIIKALKAKAPSCAVSSISLAEMLHGIQRLPNGARKEKFSLYFQNEILFLYQEIPFDHNAALVYGNISARMENIGKPKPKFDLLIAATAIANNMVLVTRNTKDFEDIPNLKLENWFKK